MHLIILPGNSKEYNEQWLKDSANAYKDLFDSVTTLTYKHWENGEEAIDLDFEVSKLENSAKLLEGEYVIFAKSAGTWVAVKAITENKISPKKCIFVGSPWEKFNEEKLELKVPTLFIQQTDDMFFKYEELEEVIDGNIVTDYRLIEIPGNNHAYDNYDEIKQWVKEFLSDE